MQCRTNQEGMNVLLVMNATEENVLQAIMVYHMDSIYNIMEWSTGLRLITRSLSSHNGVRAWSSRHV